MADNFLPLFLVVHCGYRFRHHSPRLSFGSPRPFTRVESSLCRRLNLDWAETQTNLGNTLQALGKGTDGTGHLKQAEAAYRGALKVFTRDGMPLHWATTQNNLGNALQSLGKRTGDTGQLWQSVDAYRAALEVRTRERLALDWANTQTNLGNAYFALGVRTGEVGLFERAASAYCGALEVFEGDGPSWKGDIVRKYLAEIPHMEPSQPVECGSKPVDVQFAFE